LRINAVFFLLQAHLSRICRIRGRVWEVLRGILLIAGDGKSRSGRKFLSDCDPTKTLTIAITSVVHINPLPLNPLQPHPLNPHKIHFA
jgi:hypothetical protein